MCTHQWINILLMELSSLKTTMPAFTLLMLFNRGSMTMKDHLTTWHGQYNRQI
jgi:hypothetical protein